MYAYIRPPHALAFAWMICDECGTDHDGYPVETLGGKLRCLRAQAENAGLVGMIDQIDATKRDMDATRDRFLFG